MANQDLTRNQRKIVDRYYEHRDAIMAAKIGELVTELYLCERKEKTESLWARAGKAIANLPPEALDPAKGAAVVESRDVEALAAIANRLGGARA